MAYGIIRLSRSPPFGSGVGRRVLLRRILTSKRFVRTLTSTCRARRRCCGTRDLTDITGSRVSILTIASDLDIEVVVPSLPNTDDTTTLDPAGKGAAQLNSISAFRLFEMKRHVPLVPERRSRSLLFFSNTEYITVPQCQRLSTPGNDKDIERDEVIERQ